VHNTLLTLFVLSFSSPLTINTHLVCCVSRLSQQARDAYYMKNYPDFFQTIGKTLVKKQDGTYMTVDDAELEALKQGNKLTVEIPKAMGGRVNDITQKPILILRE
jgi:hypothetical protein